MTDDKRQSKIFTEEIGEGYVAFVPKAWREWSSGKTAKEISQFITWMCERVVAGDQASLAEIPFLATHEHTKAWEEGFSVSQREQ